MPRGRNKVNFEPKFDESGTGLRGEEGKRLLGTFGQEEKKLLIHLQRYQRNVPAVSKHGNNPLVGIKVYGDAINDALFSWTFNVCVCLCAQRVQSSTFYTGIHEIGLVLTVKREIWRKWSA